MARILLVEDEAPLRMSMARHLALDGHEVIEAGTLGDAESAARQPLDAVITDISLGDQSGLDLIEHLRLEGFKGAVIVITAYGTVDTAVDAMKKGADDFLQKPLSLEELGVVVEKTIEHRRTRTRLDLMERIEQVRDGLSEVIGESEAWTDTLKLADRFASLPIPNESGGDLPTILILGETGSGKGVLARYLHDAGRQIAAEPDAPFVHVNCAALPASLIESELFGHEKGAFTDAKSTREGLFEMAAGGTIFLDEIGELPLEMQSKLLIVVENGTFRRIGGATERRARARIIAATNQDLSERVRKGEFRQDLLYRLNAYTLRVPPLRERDEDVVLLAESILTAHSARVGQSAKQFTPEARDALLRHTWPGNVRELINVTKRAALLCEEDEIGAEYLDFDLAPSTARNADSENAVAELTSGHELPTIEELERRLIMLALKRAKGNVSQAAKLIGLNRGALRYRIERMGIKTEVTEVTVQ